MQNLEQRGKDITLSQGAVLRYLFFVLAVAYWGTWLLFYGIIWMWAALQPVGLNQSSLLQINWVWTKLQTMVNGPYALITLTECLHKALPEGNATIADFPACLRSMGIAEGR
jgi:hypothetical protein